MAYKPGSVPGLLPGMTIPLGRPSPDASRDLPGRRSGNGSHAVPIWSCSRWGLPCRVRCRTRGALLPHRFTLASVRDRSLRYPRGGLFSVALSLGLPPPDVIRHRVSVEPGLSSIRFRGQQPSGHLTQQKYSESLTLTRVSWARRSNGNVGSKRGRLPPFLFGGRPFNARIYGESHRPSPCRSFAPPVSA